MNRASARRRRKDPAYRAAVNEYHRIWKNARTGAVARKRVDRQGEIWLDAQAVFQYVNARVSKREIPTKRVNGMSFGYFLNGLRMEDADVHWLRDLREKQSATTPLARVDKLANRYDLPLWEIEEAGGLVLDQVA